MKLLITIRNKVIIAFQNHTVWDKYVAVFSSITGREFREAKFGPEEY